MILDNDLLQIHINAKKLSAEGIQALVAHVQEQRAFTRQLISDVYENCIKNDELTNASKLRATVDAIKFQTGEAQHRLDLASLNWRDLIHG